MKFLGKTLGLLLVSLALASCGGGGGNGGGFSAPQSGSITLSATTTTLPTNTSGYLPHNHGPNQAEVTIIMRNADGSLMVGQDVQVSISPVQVAALSFLIQDGNDDFDKLWGTFAIKGTNGQATAWVNASSIAGTAVLTASAVDPTTKQSISATMKFTVTTGVGPQPATVKLGANPTAVYLPSSGAATTSTISALVLDGGGQPVADPVSGNAGVDNVQFSIVGPANGAQLSTSSVGGSVSGATVSTHTVHGAATASFSPGTVQGPVQIQATVDRSDNNVSNGISDPVSATTTVIVSDGMLYSLSITSPTENAIAVNPVSSNISAPTGPDGNVVVPPNPDGTYSLTVSAIATDREHNPVPAGTVIQFGAVDAPMEGFPNQGPGSFLISGNDGDPQESGTLFTAPTGQFRTAGGGAGPGDTLLVFGNLITGNSDLESARQVQSVNSNSSLYVTYPFNPNDTSGTSVNSGAVLPYVIGRAQDGTIGTTATTDANGVARTTLNYPVSRLGKGALIWARGTGAVVNGTPRLITAISGGGFPGVAPGKLSVSQTPLPGNTTVPVTVCLYDALGAPLQGASIGFGFANLGVGSASIDGTATAGVFADPTGADGCTVGTMKTSGLSGSSGGTGGSSSPSVTFTAGPSVPSLNVPIAVSGNLVLQASPSSLGGSGGGITLLLTDANGNPVANAQIGSTCTAGASVSLLPPTDANGKVAATISANLTGYKPATTSATCTFTVTGATAIVNLQGTDLCTTNPANPACGTGTTPTNDTLSVVVVQGSGTAGPVTLTSNPAGITCNLAANQATTLCSAQFPDKSTVLLNATGGTTYVWAGACTSVSSSSATVTMASGVSCQLTVNH